MSYHNPVMLQECLDGLKIDPAGIYVDVTFGGGGHSRAIVDQLSQEGSLYSFDQDTDALANSFEDERFTLVNHNFRFLKRFLTYHQAIPADGILADLGVSSHQFDTADRGFSIRFDADLDMRMDQSHDLTARDVLNNYEEKELAKIFKEYGEIRSSKKLANDVVRARSIKPIERVNELLEILSSYVKPGKEHKFHAMVFQALRIEVNDELGVLREMLAQTVDCLKVGGRLVVMSYHSLEDRLVKELIRNTVIKNESNPFENDQLRWKVVNRKPIMASEGEIKENTRARSAKLRILEKVI